MNLKYPLPQNPPTLVPTFTQLCRTLPAQQLQILGEKVLDFADRLRRESKAQEGVPQLNLVDQLARVSKKLLAVYDSYDQRKQALIVGAIAYFLFERDSIPDCRSLAGLDEDVQVMNHVLELLERPDLFIKS